MINYKLEKTDTHLIDCIKAIDTERIKRGISKETIGFRRLSKAVANLIMTDTEVRERLINAIIEDDRRKNGYG